MAVFMKYVDCTEWDNKVKQFIFRKKLKIEVFTELMYHGVAINILDNLIKVIIEINNKFY